MAEKNFTPPLGFHALTGLYDKLIARTTDENSWRPAFVRQVSPRPGHRILEFGCGTGGLLKTFADTEPRAHYVGLDPDMSAQRIARDKLADSHAKITFVEGFADALPNHKELEPASFDRIVCCLMLHHLTRDAKRATLGNAHQLLKPGGELHIADWSKPSSLKMRLAYLQIQLIDGFKTTADNARGLLPIFMADAGFHNITETISTPTRYGQFGFFRATKEA